MTSTVPVVAVETMKQAGHGDTPYVCKGDPLWRKPKPVMFAQHWKNEAARRECGGDIGKATPKHLRIVAVYRGMPARIANELRALKRRMARKEKTVRAAA